MIHDHQVDDSIHTTCMRTLRVAKGDFYYANNPQ